MTKKIGNEEKYVTQVELEYGIGTGIRLSGVASGLVSVQEEQETRLERGIGLDDWGKMDMMEKALIVAVRRNRIAMQNIQTEAEIRKSEREMNKSRKR